MAGRLTATHQVLPLSSIDEIFLLQDTLYQLSFSEAALKPKTDEEPVKTLSEPDSESKLQSFTLFSTYWQHYHIWLQTSELDSACILHARQNMPGKKPMHEV